MSELLMREATMGGRDRLKIQKRLASKSQVFETKKTGWSPKHRKTGWPMTGSGVLPLLSQEKMSTNEM